MGYTYLYIHHYLSSAKIFYCPSWKPIDNPPTGYMMYNALRDDGLWGGFHDPDRPDPTSHIMANYHYRDTFFSDKTYYRPAHLIKDSPYNAICTDHWTNGWGLANHLDKAYQTVYLDGHVGVLHNPGFIVNIVSHVKFDDHESNWQRYFDGE